MVPFGHEPKIPRQTEVRSLPAAGAGGPFDDAASLLCSVLLETSRPVTMIPPHHHQQHRHHHLLLLYHQLLKYMKDFLLHLFLQVQLYQLHLHRHLHHLYHWIVHR